MNHEQAQKASFASQQPSEQRIQTKKQSQQFKALFLKNLRLQSKQKCTNICQILTPILCIMFTFLMKTIAEQNMKVGAIFEPVFYPVKFNSFKQFDILNANSRNKFQWVTYSCNNNCNQTLLGTNAGGDPRSGLLGLIQPTYDGLVNFHPDPINNPTIVQQLQPPFFLPCNQSTINQMLYTRIQWLNQHDLNQTKKTGGLQFIPDGTYNITQLTQSSLKFDVKVDDMRQLQILRKNGIQVLSMLRTLKQDNTIVIRKDQYSAYTGLLIVTNWLTSAFMQQSTNTTIQSGVFFMPQDESGVTFVDTILSFVAVLIFPISLSLLFPVFLYTVVLEKEQKLIQMMKMNGMKISSYWLVYFIFNFILSLLTNIIFVLIGMLLTKMRFFTQTDPLLIIVTLLGWSLAQIGMAVFFQTFLNKSRSANIIGYLISIWTSMIGSTLSIGVYQYPNQMPIGPRLFAFFGFPRIIYLMLSGCSQGKCFGSIQHIPSQMKQQIAMLYVNFIFFFLLGAYLFEIVPQQFGVTRNVLFPFTMFKKFIKAKLGKKQRNTQDQLQIDPQYKHYIHKNDEDNFSKKERADLLTTPDVTQQNPLVINNLRKLYYKVGSKKMYAAVKSFNLKVGPKQTFGLLGPNGAGKTTLISMITGMFQPNFGNAWVGGYDIRTSVEKAQLQMGVCPQFDLLWPQLTVAQHLYFYARLKGIPRKQIDSKVANAIQQVKLTEFRDFPSSSLSGGMKRRLSVAISLVGDPKIVFLDEPSTGLDPQNRRQLWQVLAKCQKNRAIFITTHMMQQADALCNRVGIIAKGILRTVAPQVTLKKVYGGGYRVSISVVKQQRRFLDRTSYHMLQKGNDVQDYKQNLQQQQDIRKSVNSFIQTQQKQKNAKNSSRVAKLRKFMDQHFPGSVLLKQYNGYLIFKVLPKYKVSQIFQILQKMQTQLQVVDIAITNSSLQDVFMNVVKQSQQDKQQQQQYGNDNNDDNESDFKSFPNNKSKFHQQSININQTPNNKSKQVLQSSIISKDRVSQLSHHKDNNININDSNQQFRSITSKVEQQNINKDKKQKPTKSEVENQQNYVQNGNQNGSNKNNDKGEESDDY